MKIIHFKNCQECLDFIYNNESKPTNWIKIYNMSYRDADDIKKINPIEYNKTKHLLLNDSSKLFAALIDGDFGEYNNRRYQDFFGEINSPEQALEHIKQMKTIQDGLNYLLNL